MILFNLKIESKLIENGSLYIDPIIRQKIMSGKVLIEWKHRLCSELSRQRYMDPDITRAVHIEIANIFFNQEQEDSDEISSEHNSAGK